MDKGTKAVKGDCKLWPEELARGNRGKWGWRRLQESRCGVELRAQVRVPITHPQRDAQ